MICRAAQHADCAAMAEIAASAYHSGFSLMLPAQDLRHFDASHFRVRFGNQWPLMRVLDHEGVIKAFSMITGGHIDMFFVAADARGKGAGSVLLADAIGQGARTLETFAANLAARRFYEHHGWRQFAASTRLFGGASCDFVSYRAPS